MHGALTALGNIHFRNSHEGLSGNSREFPGPRDSHSYTTHTSTNFFPLFSLPRRVKNPDVLAISLVEEEYETIQDLLETSETKMGAFLKAMGVKGRSFNNLMDYLAKLKAAQAAATEEVKALCLLCFCCKSLCSVFPSPITTIPPTHVLSSAIVHDIYISCAYPPTLTPMDVRARTYTHQEQKGKEDEENGDAAEADQARAEAQADDAAEETEEEEVYPVNLSDPCRLHGVGRNGLEFWTNQMGPRNSCPNTLSTAEDLPKASHDRP